MKSCTKCKIEQPKSNFHKRSASADGLSYRCKPCTSKRDKAYTKKHAKKRAKIAKEWRQNNSTRYKKYLKKYRKANPDKYLNYDQLRAKRIKDQTPTQTALEKSALNGMYIMAKILSNSCGEQFHVDHIIPLSAGGAHHFDNVQILSAQENLEKGSSIASL